MLTSSARSAKICPTYTVSLASVSKSWSATDLRCLQRGVQGFHGGVGLVDVRLGQVHAGQALLGLVGQRRADERGEQRMRPRGPALQFRVRLRADKERMNVGRVLDKLDQVTVGRGPGES